MTDHCTSDVQNSAWLIEGAGYFRIKTEKLKSGRWRIREDRSYLAKIKKLTLKEWVGGQGRLHKCSDTKRK